jgi:CheY-like chemotaxis protein
MKRKILMIDDEQDICELIKFILERNGKFEVTYSTEARKGVELARSTLPDLILIDIVLPDMTGVEVMESLLNDPVTKHIPKAFLTALVQDGDAQNPSGLIGEYYFIPKTIAPDELIAKIETILQ